MSYLTTINLSHIYLWPKNPRLFYDEHENEQEVILNLVEQQNTKKSNKLLVLAKSIADNGIIEPIGVVKHADYFFEVREGNRRIACLKLLKNPYILPKRYEKIRRKFIALQDKLNEDIFYKIPARVYEVNEIEDLERWIELRHSGLQDGKGIDSWGSMEKENWRKYRGYGTPLLDFQNYLISQNILTVEQVNSVNKTIWQRILGLVGRDFLGIRYKNNRYEIVIDENKFIEKINKTIDNLAGKTVGTVYDNEKIKEFFISLNFERENVKTNLFDESNDENQTNNSVIEGLNEKDEAKKKKNNEIPDNTNIIVDDIDNGNDKDKEKVNDKPQFQQTHISKTAEFMTNITCNLESSQDTDGIIRIVNELKELSTTGHYKRYPIGTAMLMRSLLEQCLIYYLKKRNKWENFIKQNPYYGLQKIIDKYLKDTDIFGQDKELKIRFNILLKTPGIKDYLDMIVHNTHEVQANPQILDNIAGSGYLPLIQYIINYNNA